MATTSQLTQMLREAHIATLKQSYLNLMEEARLRKEKAEREYYDAANAAYVAKMQGFKDTPQQLRSLGLGGGKGNEESASIIAAYEDTMAKLKRGMLDSISEFEYTVQKQSQLMQNALAEYNARLALEDYNKSGKSGGTSSGTADSYLPTQSNVLVPGPEDDASFEGVRLITPPRRSNPV